MALHPYLSQIRQLNAEDELPSALQQLHDLLEDSPKLTEVIHQTGPIYRVKISQIHI
ncbi:hypothetical protein [Haliscomenobacter hydrossis]|uniref:Uncharacterized protein n=1 Tax=Haliscomenobacter hydrossis (strain ATCC 27775 / DSM 1100 / LMG 10767 / O) TaxID=760192 RepID=F4L2G7_HALH1|nr:hypothetical protein [Haliscomenobacter hydrossis]AEE53885.1 hypothetical protein Halhy_6063 [Haliscomenobacter hydrossis DSM 1100]